MEDDAEVLVASTLSSDAATSAADVFLAAPAAKRPRVGRPPHTILAAIEADCGAGAVGMRDPAPAAPDVTAPVWIRSVRESLLTLAAPVADVVAVAQVVHAGFLAAAVSHMAGAASALSELLCEALLNLPQSTPRITATAALADEASNGSLSPSVRPILSSFISLLRRRLSWSLRVGHPVHARLLLRGLCALSAQGALQPAAVRLQLEALLSAAELALAPGVASVGAARRGVFLLHTALAALPWWSNSVADGAAAGEDGTWLLSQGAGAQDAGAAALLDRASALITQVVERNITGELPVGLQRAGAALTALRSRQVLTGSAGAWLDAPAGGGGGGDAAATVVAAAGESPTVKLLSALRGAPNGEWAVATVARPQGDVRTVKILRAASVAAASGAVLQQQQQLLHPVGFDVDTEETETPLAPPSGSLASVTANAAWHVRGGPQLFGAGGLSATPAVMTALGLDSPVVTSSLAQWCLRDIAEDVLLTYHPFHAEAGAALGTLPLATSSGCAPAPAALGVEALVAALTTPWAPPFSETYFSLIVVTMLADELTAAASVGAGDSAGPAARAFGLAAKVLWKFAWALDDACLPPLARWLAHHISATRWEWMWDEWAPVLLGSVATNAVSLSSSLSAQRRLLLRLLDETFALLGPWHYARVVSDRFPAAMVAAGLLPPPHGSAARSALLPESDESAPPIAAAGAAGGGSRASEMDAVEAAPLGAAVHTVTAAPASGGEELAEAFLERLAAEAPGRHPDLASPGGLAAARALAAAVTAHLRERLDAGGMAAWLRDAPEAAALVPATQLLAFVHSLLMYARANMRNTTALLVRYQRLLADPPSAVAGGSAARATVLIDAARDVWARHSHVAAEVVIELVVSGALSYADAAAAILSPPPSAAPPAVAAARAADLGAWEATRMLLAQARDAAHRAGVDAALFLGARVLDLQEPEAPADAADEREKTLRAAAASSADAYVDAVLSAVAASADAARSLQAAANAAGASSAAALLREALRVALAHGRALIREHRPALVSSTRVLDLARDISRAGGGGDDDLTGIALAACLDEEPYALELPEALLRDADVPTPLH